MSEEAKKVITETIENDKWIITSAKEIVEQFAGSGHADAVDLDLLFLRLVHLFKTGTLQR